MKKTFFPFALLLLVACATQLDVQSETKPVEKPEVKIGISTILSGDFASLGQNIVDSAELAAEELALDLNIKFVVEDAKCGQSQGLTATKKLVEVDDVKVIIGGTCSDDTMASAPYVNEAKVVYITPVTGGSNIDNAGEYIFRTGNADVQAGIQPAHDFIEKFNFTKAAIITEQREYTIDIRDHFKKEFGKLGGEVVIDEEFIPDTKDFRTTLLKVKREKPDAILILSQLGTTGAHFIKQARELGFDDPMFTTFTTVVNDNAKQIAGDAMNGVYFYDPAYDPEDIKLLAFFAKYKEKYGKEPVIPFHSAATYDTVRIIVDAIKVVGNDGEKVHDWMLANVKNYDGFMGNFSLDEKGNVQTGFKLKVVQNGKFKEVK